MVTDSLRQPGHKHLLELHAKTKKPPNLVTTLFKRLTVFFKSLIQRETIRQHSLWHAENMAQILEKNETYMKQSLEAIPQLEKSFQHSRAKIPYSLPSKRAERHQVRHRIRELQQKLRERPDAVIRLTDTTGNTLHIPSSTFATALLLVLEFGYMDHKGHMHFNEKAMHDYISGLGLKYSTFRNLPFKQIFQGTFDFIAGKYKSTEDTAISRGTWSLESTEDPQRKFNDEKKEFREDIIFTHCVMKHWSDGNSPKKFIAEKYGAPSVSKDYAQHLISRLETNPRGYTEINIEGKVCFINNEIITDILSVMSSYISPSGANQFRLDAKNLFHFLGDFFDANTDLDPEKGGEVIMRIMSLCNPEYSECKKNKISGKQWKIHAAAPDPDTSRELSVLLKQQRNFTERFRHFLTLQSSPVQHDTPRQVEQPHAGKIISGETGYKTPSPINSPKPPPPKIESGVIPTLTLKTTSGKKLTEQDPRVQNLLIQRQQAIYKAATANPDSFFVTDVNGKSEAISCSVLAKMLDLILMCARQKSDGTWSFSGKNTETLLRLLTKTHEQTGKILETLNLVNTITMEREAVKPENYTSPGTQYKTVRHSPPDIPNVIGGNIGLNQRLDEMRLTMRQSKRTNLIQWIPDSIKESDQWDCTAVLNTGHGHQYIHFYVLKAIAEMILIKAVHDNGNGINVTDNEAIKTLRSSLINDPDIKDDELYKNTIANCFNLLTEGDLAQTAQTDQLLTHQWQLRRVQIVDNMNDYKQIKRQEQSLAEILNRILRDIPETQQPPPSTHIDNPENTRRSPDQSRHSS